MFKLVSRTTKPKIFPFYCLFGLRVGGGEFKSMIAAKCFIGEGNKGPRAEWLEEKSSGHLCHVNVKHIIVGSHNREALHSFRPV